MSALTMDEIAKHEEQLKMYERLAIEYEQARKKYGVAKYKLHVILTVNLHMIREKKSNVGMEMAILMMLEPGFLDEVFREEILKYYKDFIECEEIYKGLEHRIEATKTAIMYAQSVMKYVKENT